MSADEARNHEPEEGLYQTPRPFDWLQDISDLTNFWKPKASFEPIALDNWFFPMKFSSLMIMNMLDLGSMVDI